jgi:hypothetical protein
MRIAVIFAIVGLILVWWAATLHPYKDSKVVRDAIATGPTDLKDSHSASEKYWIIRDSQLTWKFRLQDYGATAFAIALLVACSALLRRTQGVSYLFRIRTPEKLRSPIVIGVVATVIMTVANAVSLFLGAARDEFPPWADSIGIPLMGTAVIFLGLLAVMGLSYWAGVAGYSGGQPVIQAITAKALPRLVWVVVFGIPLFYALFPRSTAFLIV